jgi:hypothetical protein
VLVCYLDESGKDRQNRITTVAGFVAPEKCWEAFELTVESVFQEYGVDVLHAMDLHHTRGCFRDWPIRKKRAFVAQMCQKMTPFIPLGVGMSALKSTYSEEKKRRGRQLTRSPYAFCVNVIWDWIFNDIRVGEQAHRDGVALVLEMGHQNNPDAKLAFEETRALFAKQITLHSLIFVPKMHSRAIQVSDLLAYYVRRHGVAQERAPADQLPSVRPDPILEIITAAVPVRAFVATNFGEGTRGTVTRNLFTPPPASS